MPITYVVGDAVEPIGVGPKLICHIVNDRGIWAKGFVKSLSGKWPEPEAAYRKWFKSLRTIGEGPKVLGRIELVRVTPDIRVVNMLAQRGVRWQDGYPPLRYVALEACLNRVGETARSENPIPSIHMPKIGTGLAGGKWDRIEPLIVGAIGTLNVFVYDLVKP